MGLGTLFSRSLLASVSGTKSKSPLAGSFLGKTPHSLLKTNVLVVGGGPAGIGAAMGAAMSGADTFIIENYGFFGGVGAFFKKRLEQILNVDMKLQKSWLKIVSV